MKNNPKEGIQMKLIAPKGHVIWEKLSKSDEVHTYTTTLSKFGLIKLLLDGEYTLCITITEFVFANHDVKQVKTILKFSNEYYKCKHLLVNLQSE
jgi:hypothetical protein